MISPPTAGERRWWMLIATAWVLLLMASSMRSVLPASYWYDAGDVFVFDTIEGVDATIAFDREIRRAFKGEYIVTIRRITERGPVQHCTIKGESVYSTDAVMPDPITMSWWLFPERERCDFPPGRYRMTTLWRIFVGDDVKQVKRASNIFTVAEKREG